VCFVPRFFGAYHGFRKLLQVTLPTSRETNMISAAALSMAPLAAIPRFRPMAPYGVMLVAIDAFSEFSDKS
jgi:hypothetical protein